MPDVAGADGATAPYREPPVVEPKAIEAPVIECDGLVHSFGSKSVLCGVTFQVPRGSIYGFIGQNGAGKTTTLRILATLLEPTGGTARVAGHDVTSHPERVRRALGYMPDGPGVHERVTVGEYLDFFASAHGIYREHRARAVRRVVDLTEIGPLRAIHVTTLSKGQRQRVLLARTLLHDPEVLVLDEPASDLDPRARIELRTLLGALGRAGKTILLFVPHPDRARRAMRLGRRPRGGTDRRVRPDRRSPGPGPSGSTPPTDGPRSLLRTR